jgi:hypothetical protein
VLLLATHNFAAPDKSTFSVVTFSPSGATRTGDPVYVVARLITAQGRQVYVASNVNFTITGTRAARGPLSSPVTD